MWRKNVQCAGRPRRILGWLCTGLLLAGCAAPASVTPVPLPTLAASPAPGTATAAPDVPLDAPNVAKDPADVPPPLNRTTPSTVNVTLTAEEVTAELADGTSYDFWTFDGTVPGPLLRVMEGDTVNLTLVNATDSVMGHNIDLHAVTGPGGGAEVTSVAPGQSKTLTFKALQAGAYIYHCAFPPPMHHIAQGMYGVIVVEPPGGLPPVDREFYVVQGEWYTAGAFGAPGHQAFDNTKALAEAPEYFTFNGNTAALTSLHPLEAKVGEKIRVFFGVGGPNVASNFHIIGEIFDRVYTGSPDTYVANEETVIIPPGSAAIFDLTLEEPGQYLLVDHALFRVNKGAAGLLNVTGEHDPTIYAPDPAATP
ncbi:MAG: nitrite reductase, copper-containing [Anaerolineales bacterium]|nr:nitrite reductase, copper-containing [Anaerolineales bacterium]